MFATAAKMRPLQSIAAAIGATVAPAEPQAAAAHFPEGPLVAECISGSHAAQRKFYNTYSPKLMGVCMLYSKSRFDAEDLLQEAFIKIFLNLAKYKPTGSFEGWMRRIVINQALEQQRKTNRVTYTDSDLPEAATGADEILSAYSTKELMGIIQQLPDGYRTIFNLYVFEGFNHREIADMLGIAEGTSKSQFSRARAQLQQLISVSHPEAYSAYAKR